VDPTNDMFKWIIIEKILVKNKVTCGPGGPGGPIGPVNPMGPHGPAK